MAGRRVYGGSNTAVMEALLSSGSFSSGFHGSRSMMNFEEFQGDTSKGSFCCPLELKEACDDDLDDSFHQPEKKRRLTADQVHSLEKTFELENKLEPERKIKLAKDLGLHPRQVAIWFQNRRARWKTKQLEKDYEVLKSSYNLLKADYDDLLEEKEKLKAEVLVLTDKLLVKEKKGNLDSFEPNSMLHKASKAEPDSVSEAKESEAPIMVCKQEDLSSADSAVSDSDSPRCSGVEASLYELAESTRVFEADQYSDLSYVEEDKEGKGCSFLKLEDSSGNYGFPGEDQAYWFWPF